MANIIFTPDSDAESISSDVAEFNGVLVTTQIPADLDGDIVQQSESTLQALKEALEKAGSGMDRVMHLTIYLTDMTDRAAFNEVYQRFFSKPWPVRAAVGVAALAYPQMRVEVTAMAAKG
ncbi:MULTISPECIES: RidA family protein [Pseudomonas]|uniref:Endoribonuclease L-PSP n=1 Tax=Pseudomonas putida TaxID=303 RepID=A0A379KPZ9_PSEPU|nr:MULTISPECIES: RidA family protein [Pseudomonas]GLH33159.1 reactive intermediate/imine deaminase [Pseudomonas sp. BR1R-5]SUD69487.1 endoribonuclease L-PSP [Pseudomonas putida]